MRMYRIQQRIIERKRRCEFKPIYIISAWEIRADETRTHAALLLGDLGSFELHQVDDRYVFSVPDSTSHPHTHYITSYQLNP
jgi:hypothetical protein